jgi:acetyl esterase/lipase
MTSPSAMRPGRLGDPTLTLATDPRLDPRIVEVLGEYGMEDFGEISSTLSNPSFAAILESIAEVETGMDPLYAAIFKKLPPVSGVTRRTEIIKGVDGNEIRLYIHEPEERKGLLPGILHTHGGAMAFFTACDPQYVRWRDELAASGLCVIGIEFRNAAGKLGNHPFPAGLGDCASGAQWAYQNREALGISNLVISGESGGGNLCIATALKANRG